MSTLRTIEAQIPADATNTSQILTLDGVQVRIVVKLLKNVGGWYLDTFDSDGAPIVTGLRLTVGLDIWGPYHEYPGLPPGPLFVHWQGGGEKQDPGETSFSDGDAQIMYLEGAG